MIRNAKRDEITLIKLEEQLRRLALNKARKEEPWELITKPSLLNKPVDNTKLTILIISLFAGFAFGSAYLFFKEKESGIIFELKDLIQLLPEGFVEIISTKDIESLEDNIIYLKEFINNESNQKINLITIGDIEKKNVQILRAFWCYIGNV